MDVMTVGGVVAGLSCTRDHLFGSRDVAVPSRFGISSLHGAVKACFQGDDRFVSKLQHCGGNFGSPWIVDRDGGGRSRRFRELEAGAVLSSAPAGVDSADRPEESNLGELTRADFPILDQEVNGNRLVYLDNAATSQKPAAVLAALKDYYERYNSNVHRGIHHLSAKATDEYEIARSKIATFLHASSSRDIVFTKNATEAINLVANSWGLQNLSRGDEVVLSVAEHHSNIVPWQLLSQKTGAVLKFAHLTPEEAVDLEELKGLITNKTKLVALHHVSNALGSINPIEEIVGWAKKYGAKVLVDACQSVPHMKVDVQEIGADFLVASSHKMCGPTGIGILYARSELLNSMPPFLGGGEMIADVFLDHSTYADSPSRFEAGTPAIGEAIGLGAAVDYLTSIGMDRIHQYEVDLSQYLYNALSSVPDVRIYGPPPTSQRGRAALCAFNVEGLHATDIATFLDQQHGVAVRSGHHCTQPLHRHLGTNATARASLYFYNTKEEVDLFIKGVKDTIEFFRAFK